MSLTVETSMNKSRSKSRRSIKQLVKTVKYALTTEESFKKYLKIFLKLENLQTFSRSFISQYFTRFPQRFLRNKCVRARLRLVLASTDKKNFNFNFPRKNVF